MEDKRLKKLFMYLKITIILVTGILVINLVSRFKIWRMNPQNDSMLPPYPPGTKLLIDLKPSKLKRGDFIIYKYKNKGRTGRIAALGGDELEVKNYILFVNGKRSIHKIKKGYNIIPKKIPPGMIFVLNDNPDSKLPDSLVHGPIPANKVWARVIMAIDFL